jgi:hypothetical protein
MEDAAEISGTELEIQDGQEGEDGCEEDEVHRVWRRL